MDITKNIPLTISVIEEYPELCNDGTDGSQACDYYKLAAQNHEDIYEKKIPHCKLFHKYMRNKRCADCIKAFGIEGDRLQENI